MGYIEPFYLNRTSLIGRAEYAKLEVPQTRQILQKEVRNRSGKASASLPGTGIGLAGDRGASFETQATFTMEPSDNSIVSTILDQLRRSHEIGEYDPRAPVVSDNLVEFTGDFNLTGSSQLGRFMAVLMEAINHRDVSFNSIPDIDELPAESQRGIKEVLLTSDLQPINFLAESPGNDERPTMYVNFAPGHFVQGADLDHLESEFTVVGKVWKIINEGDEGFITAEKWLLPRVPRMIRRLLMANLDGLSDVYSALVVEDGSKVEAAESETLEYLSGPALILDAIVAY